MLNLISLWIPKVILRGKNVYLRVPRRTDHRQWIALRRESKEFLQPWEPTWSSDALSRRTFRKRLRRFTEDWKVGYSYSFFIISRKDECLTGGVTLSNIRRGAIQTATLGYWIGYPFAQKGYMSEAVELTLDFAFDELGLHRIEAACLLHNEPSRNLLLKLGFMEEGIARQYLHINGQWQDHRTFGFLRSDR